MGRMGAKKLSTIGASEIELKVASEIEPSWKVGANQNA